MKAASRDGPRPSRVAYVQPDGRGIVARKWSVDKGAGPVVLVAERIAKKLIQHGWPVELERLRPTRGQGQRVRLRLLTGPETPEFLAALECAVQIESHYWPADVRAEGSCVWLQGPHHMVVRLYFSGGKAMKVARVKRGPLPCPF